MKLISKAFRMARVKGITHTYLLPTCLFANGMSHHPVFTPQSQSFAAL